MPDPNPISLSKTILNEEERPRILIATELARRPQFKFIESLPGSFRYVERLGEVDLGEFDAIIADSPLSSAALEGGEVKWWLRRIPLGLNVIYVHDPDVAVGMSNVLDGLVVRTEESRPQMTIRERVSVPGKHATRVDGLPEDLQSLAQKVLVPLMETRDLQFGHDPKIAKDSNAEELSYRPFLLGPGNLVIAASYSRGPNSEVWILPNDIKDFQPWLDLALRDWHERDEVRFPAAPGWSESIDWMTTEELDVLAETAGEESMFQPILDSHLNRASELHDRFEVLKTEASASERKLLTGQGEELQAAVTISLRVLGFSVRDMDLEWEPRERREDYRVGDPDVPEWVAIGDATGVAKGVKGAKLTALGGFTTKYVLNERPPELPSQWLIVNHFLDRDPNTRPALLRADDVALFASNRGLAIDTAGLFLLVQYAKGNLDAKPAIREYLRLSTGQVGMKDVREWIASR